MDIIVKIKNEGGGNYDSSCKHYTEENFDSFGKYTEYYYDLEHSLTNGYYYGK